MYAYYGCLSLHPEVRNALYSKLAHRLQEAQRKGLAFAVRQRGPRRGRRNLSLWFSKRGCLGERVASSHDRAFDHCYAVFYLVRTCFSDWHRRISDPRSVLTRCSLIHSTVPPGLRDVSLVCCMTGQGTLQYDYVPSRRGFQSEIRHHGAHLEALGEQLKGLIRERTKQEQGCYL